MKNLFTPEENMILTLNYYISLIKKKKEEAESYLDYFTEVEINIEMQNYAKGQIDAYEETIKMLEERD